MSTEKYIMSVCKRHHKTILKDKVGEKIYNIYNKGLLSRTHKGLSQKAKIKKCQK